MIGWQQQIEDLQNRLKLHDGSRDQIADEVRQWCVDAVGWQLMLTGDCDGGDVMGKVAELRGELEGFTQMFQDLSLFTNGVLTELNRTKEILVS